MLQPASIDPLGAPWLRCFPLQRCQPGPLSEAQGHQQGVIPGHAAVREVLGRRHLGFFSYLKWFNGMYFQNVCCAFEMLNVILYSYVYRYIQIYIYIYICVYYTIYIISMRVCICIYIYINMVTPPLRWSSRNKVQQQLRWSSRNKIQNQFRRGNGHWNPTWQPHPVKRRRRLRRHPAIAHVLPGPQQGSGRDNGG